MGFVGGGGGGLLLFCGGGGCVRVCVYERESVCVGGGGEGGP